MNLGVNLGVNLSLGVNLEVNLRRNFILFNKKISLPLKKFSLTSDEASRSIVILQTIAVGFNSSHKVFFLLRHLDKYYLKLSTAHQEFTITNGDALFKGSQIFNRESTKGQSVTHRYTVQEFIEGKYVRLYSEKSVVTTKLWCFDVKTKLKTIVEFKFQENENHADSLTCQLSLLFPSKTSFYASLLSGTEKIWTHHLREELTLGQTVLESQQFLEEFSRRNQ